RWGRGEAGGAGAGGGGGETDQTGEEAGDEPLLVHAAIVARQRTGGAGISPGTLALSRGEGAGRGRVRCRYEAASSTAQRPTHARTARTSSLTRREPRTTPPTVRRPAPSPPPPDRTAARSRSPPYPAP